MGPQTDTELDNITDAALDVAWNAIEAARAEIAALRAQLAEARAERDDLRTILGGAQAAVSAQIEWDAAIADHRHAVSEDAFQKGLGSENRHCALEAAHIADKIRAQPHDRSALDAMLSEARVKALMEAEVAYQLAILHGRDPSAAILALAQEGGKG